MKFLLMLRDRLSRQRVYVKRVYVEDGEVAAFQTTQYKSQAKRFSASEAPIMYKLLLIAFANEREERLFDAARIHVAPFDGALWPFIAYIRWITIRPWHVALLTS